MAAKKKSAKRATASGRVRSGASKRSVTTSRSAASERRSPCPIACTLDLLGDRWTLLVLRDLFLGRSRFRDFLAAPEGIPTNILTERLGRLCAHGLTERIAAEDGSGRPAYRLTEKGRSLGPLLRAARDWGLAQLEGTAVLLEGGTSRT